MCFVPCFGQIHCFLQLFDTDSQAVSSWDREDKFVKISILTNPLKLTHLKQFGLLFEQFANPSKRCAIQLELCCPGVLHYSTVTRFMGIQCARTCKKHGVPGPLRELSKWLRFCRFIIDNRVNSGPYLGLASGHVRLCPVICLVEKICSSGFHWFWISDLHKLSKLYFFLLSRTEIRSWNPIC